jgi:hypothetical protein
MRKLLEWVTGIDQIKSLHGLGACGTLIG